MFSISTDIKIMKVRQQLQKKQKTKNNNQKNHSFIVLPQTPITLSQSVHSKIEAVQKCKVLDTS